MIANIRVINTFDFSDPSHIITSDTSMHSVVRLYMLPQGLKVGSIHSSYLWECDASKRVIGNDNSVKPSTRILLFLLHLKSIED